MTISRYASAAMLTAAVTLSACTQTGQPGFDQNDPNRQTKQGALIGAGAGAILGAMAGDSDDAIKGAVIGAGIGAGIGYSLDKQEAELRQALDSRIAITNTGDRLIVTFPQDITFATDSAALAPVMVDDLQALARSVNVYANSTLQVIGHTDSDGDAAYNQQLSESRARAVAGVLLNSGVPSSRVQSFGRGESQPVASNLTPQGKAQNRRVEIVILPNAR